MLDTTKILVDEVKYKETEKGVYETLGVDSQAGALILIRPDQRKSRSIVFSV